MSVKSKLSMNIKLDNRYKAILEIAVEKMKADGIQSASKADVIRQALELYAKQRQITNDAIYNKLYKIEPNVDNPEKGKLSALVKHFGKWSGDDGEEILKLIEGTRSDAEF